MEPAEGADAGEAGWQNVLEESAQELVGLQLDGGELAGFALAKGPQEFAVGHEFDRAIGRGGFKHVTGEIAQRILTGTGRLRSDVTDEVLAQFFGGGQLRGFGEVVCQLAHASQVSLLSAGQDADQLEVVGE